jgi:type IV secretory pathway VirB2 component (pilin)
MIEILYKTLSGKLCRTATLAFVLAVLSTTAFAQASPWENAVTQLQTSFTGPIARGLSLVAIVIGGLMFAYSEGAAKKTFAGILFGCGAALAANNFMTWLFP